jgi:hypothetical protein
MATERTSTPRQRRAPSATTGSATTTSSRSTSAKSTAAAGATTTRATTSRATTARATTTRAAADAPAAAKSAPEQRRAPISEVARPLYAYVGAADLAVEKLRGLPTSAGSDLRRLTDLVGELTVEAVKAPTQVGSAVRGLPDTALGHLTGLPGRAAHLYNSCADRGEKRVTEIRRTPVAEDAVSRTRNAVSRTRAAGASAGTSARRAAEAVSRATPLPRRGR